MLSSPLLKDRIGKRYGKLVVIERAPNDRHGNSYWKCLCDCGDHTIVRSGELIYDLKVGIRSCGCDKSHYLKSRLPPGEAGKRRYLDAYKRSAKRREIKWALTDQEALVLSQGNCFYCGVKPQRLRKRSSGDGTSEEALNIGGYLSNGIDRVDNSIGYILTNCVSCCSICNIAKNKLSQQEFQNWINQLISFQFNQREQNIPTSDVLLY